MSLARTMYYLIARRAHYVNASSHRVLRNVQMPRRLISTGFLPLSRALRSRLGTFLQTSNSMAQTTQSPTTACAEYIALSSFFHQVPAPVVRNAYDRLSINQEYVLPFSKERGLTEVLAFLAKTKDGWDHIPAVCVKQDSSGTTLNVILAINKRTYADGDHILQRLKTSFEQVFRILHDSEYDKSKLHRKLLMSVISMCSSRVLCRLRLERKASKRPIQDLLKEAIFSIRRIKTQKLHSEDLSFTSTLFISEANKVIQLVVRWLKHQTLDELGDLVEGIHHLQQTAPRFHELLNIISNNDMDPSSRSSFLNIIRKVSRYWEAARKLYRTAKKFPLVRNMRIQLANLPQKAFEGQIHSSKFPDLCTCLSKLGLTKGQQDVPQLCQNLKLDQKAARTRYEEAQKALSASKIHAEIQIVAFCEMHVQKPFPRVVSSSKDACFLCDTFIQLYGRMHTPRAHGRLYPGWRLPSLPEFGALQQRFNERLDESLRHNVSLGLAQGKLPVHPFPNESNLLTLSDSSTTVNLLELVSESSEERMNLIDSSSTLSQDSPRYGPSLALTRDSSTACSLNNFVETVYLAKGELINDSVRFNRPFRLYIAESLEVHLGLENQSTSGTKKGSLGYGIKRLTVDNFQYMREKCPVVDVQQLDGEVLFKLSEDNSFCLAAGDVVLKINTQGWTNDE